MRRAIYQTIAADTALNDLGITGATLFAESAAEGIERPRPFAVIRYGAANDGYGDTIVRDMAVWVHDVPGSYSRIDVIINRLHDLLTEVVGMPEDDGGWVNVIQWLGDSDDLSDDAQGTIVRNINFRVVGSRS